MRPVLTLANRAYIRRFLLYRTLTYRMPRRVVPTLQDVSTARSLTVNLTRVATVGRFTHNRHIFNRRLQSRGLLHNLINFRRTNAFQANVLLLNIQLIVARFSVMSVNRGLSNVAGISVLLVLRVTRRISTGATTRTVPRARHQARKGT